MRCLFYQWRISSALDSQRPSARLPAVHLARCPACRAFYERSLALAKALRAEATGDGVTSGSPGCHGLARRASRVGAPCGGSARLAPDTAGGQAVAPRRRTYRLAAVAALAAAACIVAAVLLLAPSSPPVPPVPPVVQVEHSQPPAPTVVVASSDPFTLLVHRRIESLAGLAKEPLVREFNRTRDEARAAGEVLVSYLSLPLPEEKHD